MKERPTSQIEKDNAILDFVNYQAQEAILDPNLPDSFKDEVVRNAVRTIKKLAEEGPGYHAKYGEYRRIRRPR